MRGTFTDANGQTQDAELVVLGGAITSGGSAAGLVVVAGSAGGQGHNRELSSAQITALSTSAVVKFTWLEGSRPASIEVKPIGGACWVIFDAPDAATALAWAQGASGEAVDSQRYLASEYLPEEDAISGASESGTVFEFTSLLSNMYILEHTSAITALTVEAS